MPYASLIVKYATDLAELQTGVKRATTIVERELKGLQRTAQNFQSAFQAVLLGTGAVTAARALIGAAKEAEESEKRLAAAIKATGGAVGLTTKQIEDLNDELTQTSRFDDEGIRTAAANLVNFGNISEDVFKRALKLAADLAERTGEDIGSAATKLGKGLQDPGNVDSVAKGIIKLTAAEKERADELVRLNDLQGAQNILLDAGERRIGGTAEAMNTGLLKATADVAKEWSNLLEELGRTEQVGGLVTKMFEGLASLMKDVIKTIRGVPNALIELNRDIAQFILESPLRFTFAGPAAKKMLEDANRILGSGKITNPAAEEEARAEAKTAAANARATAAAEEAARRRKEIAKATAGTLVSIEIEKAKRIAAGEQELANDRLEMLERFHAEGLIGEKEYWASRLSVQQEALRAQIAAADAEIAQRKRAVGNASRDAAVTGAGAVAFLTAQKELAVAIEKRQDLEAQAAKLSVKNSLEARAAAMQYKDALADINAQLLELQGNSEAAAAIRFEQQTRVLRGQAADDPEAQAKIAALRKATVSQAGFNDAMKRAQLIQAQLGTEEERIRNSRETGAISEMRSLMATGEARKRAVEQLNVMADDLERIAKTSGNVFLIQEAEAFRVEIERLANQTDLLAQKFDKIGESAFSDFLTDIIDGTKSVSAAFKSMADSIVKQINRIAAEEIATRIFGGRPGAGGNGMGFGSFMSQIFSGRGGGGFLGGLFGGGSSGLAIDAVLAAGGGGILPFASGGRFRAGQPMLVGEDGPELILPDTGGTVVPNGRFGGGMTVVNQFTISAPVDRRTQQQIAASAALGASRASRRNN